MGLPLVCSAPCHPCRVSVFCDTQEAEEEVVKDPTKFAGAPLIPPWSTLTRPLRPPPRYERPRATCGATARRHGVSEMVRGGCEGGWAGRGK